MPYNDPNDPNYRSTAPTYSFDPNATRQSLLESYAPLFATKKERLQQDTTTALNANEQNYNTNVTNKRRSLSDYLLKATDSFANRGLFNSGLRTADATKATDLTNETINQYLLAKQAKDTELNTGLSRGMSDYEKLLNSQVDTGVAKAQSDAFSNYNSEYDKYNRYLSAIDSASSSSTSKSNKYLQDLQDKAIKESLTNDLFNEAQVDENGNPRDLNAALSDVEANRTSILKAGFTPAEIDALKKRLKDQYALQATLQTKKNAAQGKIDAAKAFEAKTKSEGAPVQALAGLQRFVRGLPGFNLFKYGS